MKPYQIGIDLGGTKTETILFDPKGKEIFRKRIPTPRPGKDPYQAILDTVHGLISETIRHIPGSQTYTIGVGIPGTIAPETDLVQNANTTCLNGKPFKQELEKCLSHPIGIENDANCFTLAETLAGAAKGYRIVFGIILGTGCGGGMSIDGKIHRGKHWIAGEWGHFSVDPDGASCFCENRGCVETKLSGTGVENAFFQHYGKRLTMETIVDGYRKGHIDCTQTFKQFLDDFGRCLGGLISILDPDVIVLGGGLSNIDELYSIGVESVRRYAFHEHVTTPILKNRLGDSAGVYGAAWIGVDQ